MSNAKVLAPKLYELVRLQGEVENDKWVHHIEFKGLTFKHTDRLPEDKWPQWWIKRQWENPDAAVFIQGAHDCVFQGNKIVQTGAYGMTLCHYAQNIDIVANEIGHNGCGGIFLWGYGPGTTDVNHHNKIVRNYIHDQGLANYWHSASVQIYQSGSNDITHNLMQRSAYNCVSMVGADAGRAFDPKRVKGTYEGQVDLYDMFQTRWEDMSSEIVAKAKTGWRPNNVEIKPFLHSGKNNVSYNVIVEPHSKLNEGGAIYAWYCGKGNVWHKNLVYKNGQMPGSSIFALDNRAEYITVTENVAWIRGKILNVVGARSNEKGNVIHDNYHVCYKKEWISRYGDKIGKWWFNEQSRESVDKLYREISHQVDITGGWPGVSNVGIPGFGGEMIDISNEQELPKDMNVLYKE